MHVHYSIFSENTVNNALIFYINWAVNADARYDEYKEPSVRSAYVGFQTELEGGLTEEDKQIIAKLEARIKAKAQNHGEQS